MKWENHKRYYRGEKRGDVKREQSDHYKKVEYEY
jgi:hypothetical protein